MSAESKRRQQAGPEEFHGDLLSTYGREPMLPREREYKFLSAHGTCFAYTIATWCFLTGGIVANYVGAVEGIVCLVAGNLIGTDVENGELPDDFDMMSGLVADVCYNNAKNYFGIELAEKYA